MTLCETNNTEYSYTDDFDKILQSIYLLDNQVASEQTKEEKPTAEEVKKEEPKQEETPKEEKKSSIPAFAGSSLSTAVDTASKFGVSEAYDEDFGHGTRCKALSDSSGGLMINIIYVSSTKEIMCANITTNKLASSSSDQKKFVKGMASVLCPSADSSDVSSWVNNNVGGKKTTTIGDFTYEVSLGPVDIVLYYAGNAELEEWELSQ